ncbi:MULTISPECIES: tetratricopeptide repeat protein [Pasteurellaceae]|uniref:Tetratricopeptide repeat protein n=1 Tax=Pasteurella atlantica TaxID=2827233 RepID=A0AAW8CQ16_9PAST|nr:tetratricopeptide repeat protein [Pasteurella atlantica]MBR0573539.1 tetratricopeptide repeat protein [Pasteurella atlantica]MDP8039602.1 tetratricopeptide repeat protein [Pasteurella atlantica]MDP8041693.1 tetratricopeptide repeat protein [Pasteurella atlantica]MDP8043828.1 tetratricopeptide repeat protein [Pasteurella atlantica]MDP8045914.1 tetratricopeptide repeat protein [Pasteurella atlantica]
MYSKFLKKTVSLSFILALTACANLTLSKNGKDPSVEMLTPQNIVAKEKLYESTLNYAGLISLYREVLKNQEDSRIRYKLADSYYQKGNGKEALFYLQPLLNKPEFTERAMLLQVKCLVQNKKYHEAVNEANKLITKFTRNPEAYNARGIAFAQLGRLDKSEQDFMSARERFLTDLVAINNLAMLNIIKGEYKNAVRLLLPQYLDGQKESRLLHNLVLALVKSGDTKYALDIIEKERLNTSETDLVNALKRTERVSKELAVR